MNNVILKQLQDEIAYSYSPYSNFALAAIVSCKDGRTFSGVNIENASYGLSMCAERVAIYKAISEHINKDAIDALYVYTNQDTLIYPCGACLQVMLELLPLECKIIIKNEQEEKVHTIEELYPFAFHKEDLHDI